MSALEGHILLLRLALLVGLYLFLGAVVLVAWRDLQVTARHVHQPSRPGRRSSLIVIDAGNTPLVPGETFPLQPVTSLGRALRNTIVLPDPATSAEHALIYSRNGSWWIEDLGSTNGTYLNSMRIEAPTAMAEGDVIGIGQVHLRLSMTP